VTELAVLVPVLNRPANVVPLVESFLTGCPSDSMLCFVAESGDTDEIAELMKVGDSRVDVLVSGDTHTWPEKINVGYRLWDADWYLCAADDVRFHEGWWDATATLRDVPRIGVIGTNDLGNPRVIEGSHTCHPLIRREYAELGTWDQPNTIACEQYQHWYVDNEIVITARMRRAWAPCPEAVVEHLHPYWQPDKIMWDATYAHGEANATHDLETWQARWLKYGGNV
jgi:glycosyltransferase involved in cell wall biosynthesis